MALRATTSRLLNARLLAANNNKNIIIRAQSTLHTGEVAQDPQIGDYPNLPRNSNQLRSPFGWWDNQDRRNFNETLHEEDEILGVWGPDIHTYSPYKALGQLTLFFTLLGGFSAFIYKVRPERPCAQRSYPFDGLKEELGSRENDIRTRGARTE
ncbi:hypothetical protein DFQ28_002790 [Apophysomyces sp. BC1034]|nr:hypothetical protein DFQ30_003130 [Apophysomyces sp. BC1015]KAG0179481.1 hypothetical protein DFQ29_002066 [Apophysomyces sp. BC1021]KAG0189873.1 hypothetical protein DFQ28_002790 [Apophysomyces sp. BC1034]